jgi:hypothetical protein
MSRIQASRGILLFDYTLRFGLLTRSNALNIAHPLAINK